MAEFSSTMVYLMWHLRNPTNPPLNPNVLHSRPDQTSIVGSSSSFRKYCRTILQQTQLSESVILLSLKYISLLLRNNPQLRGAEGSEYRLFTVALMLANKFLDDNTFTNKTWSDISGMKVNELNVMEFEFLDVLRFALFIPKADFDHWKQTLFNFRNQYYDQTIDPNHRALHQQQLIETTLKNMGLPFQFQYQQDIQWQQQQQIQQQEAARQQQAAAAAAAAQQQQQYNQQLYLLSKAQQPHLPPQPLNRQVTRVPLRIPVRPVYQTQGIQATSSGSHAATVYEPSVGVSIPTSTATVIQPVPAVTAPASLSSSQQPPIVQSHNMPTVNNNSGRRTPIVPSTTENNYVTSSSSTVSSSYPPSLQNTHPHQQHHHHHHQPPPPRINTNHPQRPYDYTRTGSDESIPHMNLYPQSSSAQVVTPTITSHSNYYNTSTPNDTYPQPTTTSQPQMLGSGGGHRTTSLASATIDAATSVISPLQHMAISNHLTSVATAPSLQQVSNNNNSNSNSNYYNTPTATPKVAPFNDHSNYMNGTAYNNSSNSNNNHINNNSINNHSHPSSRPMANNPNNPIRPYYMDHNTSSQPSQIISTPSSADYNNNNNNNNYGTPVSATDPYRPVMGRTSSNPSYQVNDNRERKRKRIR
ncbi:unnamed protein product [Cunninghamella blakesleeana]